MFVYYYVYVCVCMCMYLYVCVEKASSLVCANCEMFVCPWMEDSVLYHSELTSGVPEAMLFIILIPKFSQKHPLLFIATLKI